MKRGMEMETVINKIKEVQSNYVGMEIYSTKNNRIVASYNSELNIPLASSSKISYWICSSTNGEGK